MTGPERRAGAWSLVMDAELKVALGALTARLVRMEHKLDSAQLSIANLHVGGIIMSQEMDTLVAAVEVNTSVDQSVLTFLQGIAAQITDAAGDRAKSLQLAQSLTTSANAVSAALLANTPVTP